MSKILGLKPVNKVLLNPSYLSLSIPILQHHRDDIIILNYSYQHPEILYFGPGKFTSRNQLPTRRYYRNPTRHMQEHSINTIQETLSSQFRLVLLVTP